MYGIGETTAFQVVAEMQEYMAQYQTLIFSHLICTMTRRRESCHSLRTLDSLVRA